MRWYIKVWRAKCKKHYVAKALTCFLDSDDVSFDSKLRRVRVDRTLLASPRRSESTTEKKNTVWHLKARHYTTNIITCASVKTDNFTICIIFRRASVETGSVTWPFTVQIISHTLHDVKYLYLTCIKLPCRYPVKTSSIQLDRNIVVCGRYLEKHEENLCGENVKSCNATHDTRVEWSSVKSRWRYGTRGTSVTVDV